VNIKKNDPVFLNRNFGTLRLNILIDKTNVED